jgi:uncharacterized protein YdeI (YjbR/CyaY-like superfamily)
MGKKDARVDAYIAKSADFAKPILKHLRELVHANCPAADETTKWSCPAFLYKNGIFCIIAAFKAHCMFRFWHPLMHKPQPGGEKPTGEFGKITKLADLPKDPVIKRLIKQAMHLHDSGVKPPTKTRKPAKGQKVPVYFDSALRKNKSALANFKEMSTSCRNEYITWLAEAKRDETRAKRLETALQWISQGKSRNWKYENCAK